jgi:hypothetical protein
MFGWFGDLGRLSWGLLYWNWRKSLFRIRGAAGRAPCQHPSDSGKAGETACEACANWKRTDRFHLLCPLLKQNAAGRRVCSVGAAQVRPFWGRALLIYGCLGGGTLLAVILSAFGVMRGIGYRVPLYIVAWPPAWHRIKEVRAEYFFGLAQRSLGAGDVRQTYLALNQVYALDPNNAPAALLLAQFTQLGNPDFSDEIYGRMIRLRLGDPEVTAESWFRALLSRGDMPGVAALAAQMLGSGSSQGPAWAQALTFAEAMEGDTGEVDKLLAKPRALPAEERSVLEVARAVRTGTEDERRRVVTLFMGGATTPFEIRYSLNRLIHLGAARDVAAYLEGSQAAALAAYDRESLKIDAYAALGWRALARREMGFLMDQGTSVPVVTLIAGNLVRFPDPVAASQVFERLKASPLPGDAASLPGHLSLLCMAGVNGLDMPMKAEADIIGGIVGGSFPAWVQVHDFFEGTVPSKNPAAILPALPQLPLELVYALYEQFGVGKPQTSHHPDS